MFQTKRSLKNRIRALEEALEDEKELTRLSAFAEQVPPCKSTACALCEHCFRYYNGASTYALGCLKGIDCEQFELVKPGRNGVPVRCYNANQAQKGNEGCNDIGD